MVINVRGVLAKEQINMILEDISSIINWEWEDLDYIGPNNPFIFTGRSLHFEDENKFATYEVRIESEAKK
jgi:hypothetical protein